MSQSRHETLESKLRAMTPERVLEIKKMREKSHDLRKKAAQLLGIYSKSSGDPLLTAINRIEAEKLNFEAAAIDIQLRDIFQ